MQPTCVSMDWRVCMCHTASFSSCCRCCSACRTSWSWISWAISLSWRSLVPVQNVVLCGHGGEKGETLVTDNKHWMAPGFKTETGEVNYYTSSGCGKRWGVVNNDMVFTRFRFTLALAQVGFKGLEDLSNTFNTILSEKNVYSYLAQTQKLILW